MRELKTLVVEYNDTIELVKLIGNNKQLDRLQEYLIRRNTSIKLVDCYDSQSGWAGKHVMLEGVDLSGNGYCYNPSNLIKHIDTFEEHEKVKDTKEYKLYLSLKTKYNKYD